MLHAIWNLFKESDTKDSVADSPDNPKMDLSVIAIENRFKYSPNLDFNGRLHLKECYSTSLERGRIKFTPGRCGDLIYRFNISYPGKQIKSITTLVGAQIVDEFYNVDASSYAWEPLKGQCIPLIAIFFNTVEIVVTYVIDTVCVNDGGSVKPVLTTYYADLPQNERTLLRNGQEFKMNDISFGDWKYGITVKSGYMALLRTYA